MCEITCHLFQECVHYYRILALCTAKEGKCLQQYYQDRRRLEHSRPSSPGNQSVWNCFSSSSSGRDSIPRPLLRPATQFSYTTREPPKAGTRYSCRASKIVQKTAIHWDACQECVWRSASAPEKSCSRSKAPAARAPANRYKPLPPAPQPQPPLPRSRLPSDLYAKNYRAKPTRY